MGPPRLSPLVALLGSLCVMPAAPAAAPDGPLASLRRERLRREHPGVVLREIGTRARAIAGTPMADGPSPRAALDAWMKRYGAALRGAGVRLVLERTHALGSRGERGGGLIVFAFRQVLDGIPVEGALARVVVENTRPARVVYAGADLFRRPAPAALAGGRRIDGAAAAAALRATRSFGALPVWGRPQLVLYRADAPGDPEDPVLAWRVRASDPTPGREEAYTLFARASDGRLVGVRDEIVPADIAGRVTGRASPGTLPDEPGNPPAATPLPSALVTAIAGETGEALTGADGRYLLPHSGTGDVTLASTLAGPWVRVASLAGGDLRLEATVPPPGPADFDHNEPPAELATAQVNGFLHATATHDFFKTRLPGFTGIDLPITCNVNIGSTCNAYFSSATLSINFYAAGGGCVNTAYSSVVAHEYGHFVVDRLGLAQGAFGEGFADLASMLQLDDPVVGRDFAGPGTWVRDPSTAGVQYPCNDEAHTCGMVLAGCWWDLLENLRATEGDPAALETTRGLFADWAAVTLGGIGTESAHPITAVEVLTVDDDDGNLANGTPHRDEICSAFAAHGIECPGILPLTFSFPDGLPEVLVAGEPTSLRVVVEPAAARPIPGTGRIAYRIGGGTEVIETMDEGAPNEYTALLPPAACLEDVTFHFEADDDTGGTATDPPDAPASEHHALAALTQEAILTDDFEGDLGWTASGVHLTDGAWERGVPAGDGTRGDPTADEDGSGRCYLTANRPGNSDVDGGPARLLSPPLDLAGADAEISYAWWLYNDDGDDSLVVEISPDGGDPWTEVRRHTGGAGGWHTERFLAGDYVVPGPATRVRFSVADDPNDSVTEAALDAFTALRLACDPAGSGEIALCGEGGVDAGCGPPRDILLVNDSAGGPDRTLAVATTTPLHFRIVEPPSRRNDGRDTRACLYLWYAAPTADDRLVLPQGLGTMCFGPASIATRLPEITFNAIGVPGRLGEHDAPEPPPRIPDAMELEFHTLPQGVGAILDLTVQGIVQDDCSAASKRFSVTNGLVVEVR